MFFLKFCETHLLPISDKLVSLKYDYSLEYYWKVGKFKVCDNFHLKKKYKFLERNQNNKLVRTLPAMQLTRSLISASLVSLADLT